MKYLCFFFTFLYVCTSLLFAQPAKRFIPWAKIEENGQHLCPLCGKVYQPKDFKKFDPKLSLSEWHDNNLDSLYFWQQVADISDEELARSLTTGQQPTARVTIETMLLHKKTTLDNQRYFNYSYADEQLFMTADEFRSWLAADTNRVRQIVHNANQLLALRFPYGSRTFSFPDSIDFDFPFGESSKYGFHYWYWSAPLLHAWLYHADERYPAFFQKSFNNWYNHRNKIKNSLPQFDVVWYELGLGVRLPYLIDFFRVWQDSPVLDLNTRINLLKTFLGSGRWLAASLHGNPYHPYNWPIYSAVGLAYLAACFPEFVESERWLQISQKVMDDHLQNDLFADGGYIERTPGYSMGIYAAFNKYFSIHRYFVANADFYIKNKPLLEKMVSFYHLTNSPLQTCCPFNDSHRGNISGLLKTAAVNFNRPDWLTGNDSFCSVNFPQSEFAVMRSNWGRDAMMLMLNYGAAANHTHEDIMDFELYANGAALAVDAGLGGKGYDDELHKPWYRKSQSHNMVVVNDSSIDRGQAMGEDVIWALLKQVDYFSAVHGGYRAKFGVDHRRHVLFIKDRYWMILDQLSGSQPDHWDWLLHSPLTLQELGDGYCSQQSPGMLVLPAGQPARSLHWGMADVGALPGEKVSHRDINYIRFRLPGGQRDLAVLVFPFADQAPAVQFSKVRRKDSVLEYAVSGADGQDRIYISDGKERRLSADLTTDARVAVVQDTARRLALIDASRAKFQTKTVLAVDKRGDWEKEYYSGRE